MAVVAELGQDPGAELVAEAGRASDELMVGVLAEGLSNDLGEAVGVGAFGLQDGRECSGLLAHRLFDQRWVMQLWLPHGLVELFGQLVDAAFAAGPV
ncbi:hypothetical protein ACQPZ8_32320 [Actinomadura nitritigenes]|uniref:hypothetical protein n=1 Tax=Actinomadura nitritigenes TaxID=134602 RepID=UPI003D8E094F